MKMVGVQCPNCGGNLVKENGVFVCNSCGSVVTIDYDDSDVAYERLQGEAERQAKEHAHQKELLEKQYELQRQAQIDAEKRQASRQRKAAISRSIKAWIARLVALGVLAGMAFGIYMMYKYMQERNGNSSSAGIFATPTPAPNYDVTPQDVMPQMNDFVETGRKRQMDITQCAYWDHEGAVDFYDKTDAVFYDAYLVTRIPEVDEEDSCRLVIIYQVTWHNEYEGDQICYDAVYFEGLRVNPNGGGVITEFNPLIISRSDAAWGWSMAYSFEEYDQCYRENITALGGRVTKVEFAAG